MKRLSFVMIILIITLISCADAFNPQETEQVQTGSIEPVTTDEQGQNEPDTPEIGQTEIEQSEIEQTEIETPETDPPIEEPPEIEQTEIEPPVIETPEINFLQINELRTEFSSDSKRAEYVELKAIQSGNLKGVSIHFMFDAKNPFVYNFPDISVKSGEYITLHLRTLETNCIDELGDNLALSGGNDSCPTARDLWVSGSEKYLHKTEIVYLQNASEKVLDAIIMNEKPSAEWEKSRSHFAGIAEYLCNVGAWESEDGGAPTPFDAVDTSTIKTSLNKSVSRYEGRENHFNTTDWYVTESGNASPGLPNK